MCIQIAVTPTGIPFRYKTEKMPLTKGLRMTLNLSRPADHVYTGNDSVASVAERVRRQDRLRLVAVESFTPVPEEHRSPQYSAGCEPMRMTRDQENVRCRRKDRKVINRGKKIVKLIPGDKPHNHGKYIRCLKGNLKRGLN